MALAFTALAAASANTSNNAANHTGTAGTPAAGDLLIACVSVTGNTAVGSMSGAWTWYFLTSFTKNAGADTIFIFYAAATAATSTTPVYTISGNSTGSAMHVVRVTGGDSTTNPLLRQFKTATGSSANPAVTMDAAILTGNGCLGFATNTTNSAAQWTAPGSWGEIASSEVSFTNPAHSQETASRASGETGSTITWTNANTTAWGIIVMEFYVSGTGISMVDPVGSAGMFGI